MAIYWGDYHQIKEEQFIRDDIVEKALEDPAIMAIFQSADPHLYMEQLMVLALDRQREISNFTRRVSKIRDRMQETNQMMSIAIAFSNGKTHANMDSLKK